MEPEIEGGYVIKARKYWTSRIASMPPATRETWDYVLSHACHKKMRIRGVLVNRGQVFCTYQEIREALAWNVGFRKKMYTLSHIRTAMKNLRLAPMISTLMLETGMLITIVKYDYFQNPANYTEQTNRTPESQEDRNITKNHVSGITIISTVDNSEKKTLIDNEKALLIDKFKI